MAVDRSLTRYRDKRDFSSTGEPAGAARARRPRDQPLAYVVQRHQARRLHYDFRLELDGVLVSWAVPKGPSRDPEVKRLAVHVEDHPLEYGGFEGDIPKGQYGAGHVDIWDSGTWKPSGDPARGLARGHLRFELEGGRLQGGWVLLRISKEEDQWLLRKLDDAHTVPGDDAEAGAPAAAGRPRKRAAPRKAATARKSGASAKAARQSGAKTRPPGRAAAMPRDLAPQLATLVDRPPSGSGWSYEIKYDGYRIMCALQGRTARLASRNANDWTTRMKPLAEALGRLELGAGWLDGEVVCLDERGISDFQALQNALDGDGQGLRFVAFDLPYWNGRDLRRLPLAERQAMLEALLAELPEDAPLLLTQRLEVADDTEGAAAWTEACRLSLEGLICKRLDSAYVAGRSSTWLKLKCQPRQEFVIGGYTAPAGSRSHLGSLLLGLRQGKRLDYAGRVGTGFDSRTLDMLARRLRPLRRATSPFAQAPRSGQRFHGAAQRDITWVQPELLAEIRYAGWTRDKLLRQAVFLGLREDKPASQAGAEIARPVDQVAPRAAQGESVAKTRSRHAGVTITHPDRVVLHEPDTTKGDLARYYEAIGAHMMPHLEGRRVALLRCPEGADATCFFQKHLSSALPDGVAADDTGLIIESVAGLLALVQYGAIEFHTWGARAPHHDKADRITLDLDPGPGVSWRAVVEGARRAKALLEDVGLVPFLKTTGGKGLHVVAPLRPTQPWDTVKAFAQALAVQLARESPADFTANMSKARRRGKIFVDYLRNGNGATAVAAFAVRARAGAPVSMPISWDALDQRNDLRGAVFNIRNALETLQSGPDPWRDYASRRRTLGPRMVARLGR
ncbi:DNA ligase D [Bordetella petrii]|uniref:DNA ligase D n=1 Tax=Bordetella petrii TaxID=94624 RepID=UPI00372E37FE